MIPDGTPQNPPLGIDPTRVEAVRSLGLRYMRFDGLSRRARIVLHGFILVVLTVLVLVRAERYVDDHRWASDGWQYARLAFNLYKYDSFSLSEDDKPSPEPTSYREPVAPAIVAAFFYLDPAFSKDVTLAQIREGPLAERIKRHQYVLLIAIALTAFWLTRRMTGSLVAAYVGFLLCGFSAGLAQYVNTTSTELPAALILTLGCAQLLRTAEKPTVLNGILLGLVFAALALTRASFLYFLPFLAIAILCFRWMRLVPSWRRAMLITVVVLIGFSAPVGGWAFRNLMQFDSFSITQRGGSVLLFRAYMNGMNSEEFRGAFFAYARNSWLRRHLSSLTGFSSVDLAEGGRLQRLNRKFDISFYQRGRATWSEKRREYREQGYPDYAFRGDHEIRDEALQIILADPIAHLRTTLAVGWRSLFMERGNSAGKAALTFLYVLSLFAVPIIGLVTQQWVLVLVALPPGFLFCFTAFLTHGLPRYNQPMLPMLAVLGVTFVFLLVRRFGRPIAEAAAGKLQWPAFGNRAGRKASSDARG